MVSWSDSALSPGAHAGARVEGRAMQSIVEWLLVAVGALLCIGGAIGFWQAQTASPAAPLWPLPALVLFEWMLLGMISTIAAFGERRSKTFPWANVRWAVCGALFGLLIVGVFSIGPLALLAALAFLGAALLDNYRHQRGMNAYVGALTAGTVANIVLLLLLIRLANG